LPIIWGAPAGDARQAGFVCRGLPAKKHSKVFGSHVHGTEMKRQIADK
jgi:hypothetical protein